MLRGDVAGREDRGEKAESIQGTGHTIRLAEPRRTRTYSLLGQKSTMLAAGECRCAKSLPSVRLFATPWTVDHQSPLSSGLSRQESWNGLPCPPPGDLPNPGIQSNPKSVS